MKLFLTFITIIIIGIFSLDCNAQTTTKDYTGSFTANAVSDSVLYWEIYIERKANNSGFILQDGMEWTASLGAPVQTINNTGQSGTISFPLTFPADGQFTVIGVIANNGLRSQMGTSASVRVPKKPGKPTNVLLIPKP